MGTFCMCLKCPQQSFPVKGGIRTHTEVAEGTVLGFFRPFGRKAALGPTCVLSGHVTGSSIPRDPVGPPGRRRLDQPMPGRRAGGGSL